LAHNFDCHNQVGLLRSYTVSYGDISKAVQDGDLVTRTCNWN